MDILKLGGEFSIPETTYIEKGVVLDVCGKMDGVLNLVARNGGEIKVAYPSSTGRNDPGFWDLESLMWDYEGQIGKCVFKDKICSYRSFIHQYLVGIVC